MICLASSGLLIIMYGERKLKKPTHEALCLKLLLINIFINRNQCERDCLSRELHELNSLVDILHFVHEMFPFKINIFGVAEKSWHWSIDIPLLEILKLVSEKGKQ